MVTEILRLVALVPAQDILIRVPGNQTAILSVAIRIPAAFPLCDDPEIVSTPTQTYIHGKGHGHAR